MNGCEDVNMLGWLIHIYMIYIVNSHWMDISYRLWNFYTYNFSSKNINRNERKYLMIKTYKKCHKTKCAGHVTCQKILNMQLVKTHRKCHSWKWTKYATCHYGQNMSRVKAQKKMSHVKTHKTCHLSKSTNNITFQSARTMTLVKTKKHGTC